MRLLTRDESGRVCVTRDITDGRLPPYAVLSHTWGKDEEEVTLQDFSNGDAAKKAGYKKIEFCLEQAERDGLRHCWVDTCCIDKTNQAELAKSIVSMFRWYKNSEKCYVFLSDVLPDSSTDVDLQSLFQASRWFRRGWTLQELLAPSDVVLFNSNRERLGTKVSLAREISAVTRIPAVVLQSASFDHFTTIERFSWQEGRETKEPEDLAYSLLGLFGVSMAIIYGEGYAKARQRLDEEITKATQGFLHNEYSITPSLSEVVQVTDFVGRVQELHTIRDALRSDGSRRYCTIHGLGGMGKTQLALQYATRYKDLYSTILWFNIDSKDTVATSFVKAARHILSQPTGHNLDIDNSETNTDKITESVKSWLGQPYNTRWLLVFDNYDNPKVPENRSVTQVNVHEFLPTAHQGSIIITTRSARISFGHVIHLQKLEHRHESIQILSATSGRQDLDQDSQAEPLLLELDGLPLALATAGSYLSQTNMSLGRYLQLYRTSWAKLQQTSDGLVTYDDRKLFSTWQVTFDHIKQRNYRSANFLLLAAYFSNEDIWLQLLQHTGNEYPWWIRDLIQDELDFEAAVQLLCSYGLVEKASAPAHRTESSGYSMHKCVHAWTKSILGGKKDRELVHYAFRCVLSHIPYNEEAEWWITQRRLLKHVSSLVSSNEDFLDLLDLSLNWDALVILYTDQRRFAEPEAISMRVLVRKEKEFGAEHEFTLRTVSSLGILYLAQDKLAEAEAALLRAIAGCKKTLGAEHKLTINTIHNLGSVYQHQDRLVDAEASYLKALAGYKKVVGQEHKLALPTICNLGSVYRAQGKLSEAEAMFSRALAGYEVALGTEHTSTLAVAHELGVFFSNQGKLSEAEAMISRALTAGETALGAEHVSVLRTVNDLGALYHDQGRLDEAEVMYLRALAGKEETLKAEHASTLRTVENLGHLYFDQGRLSEAKAMHERALAGFRKQPTTAACAETIKRLEDWVAWLGREQSKEKEQSDRQAAFDSSKALDKAKRRNRVTVKQLLTLGRRR